MIIRPLSPRDRKAWEDIWQESVNGVLPLETINHTYIQIMGKEPQVMALVAEDDEENGKIIGLLHYVVHPVAGCVAPVCYMQDLYVSPNNRRQGVAREMIAELESIAEKRGFDRIYWLLESSNTGAKEFYKGLGVNLDFGLYMIPIKMKERLNLPENQ